MLKKSIGLLVGLQLFLMNALFAEEAVTEAPPRDQGFMQTITMILIALVFFYFIIWRPEQKRRKMLEQQRTSMKKGDRVTAMGIIGTVVKVQDHTVILRMFDGSKIEVLLAAINDIQPGNEVDDKEKDKENKSE